MTSIIRRLVGACAFACGLAALHAPAFALVVPEHGSICKPYGDSASPGLIAYGVGLYNGSGTTRTAVCPIERTFSAPPNGFSVVIHIYTGAGATSACQLASFDELGNFMGSVATVPLPPGKTEPVLTLPQVDVPDWSFQVVLCTMPTGSVIYGISPVM
jgi:hypothetical protein